MRFIEALRYGGYIKMDGYGYMVRTNFYKIPMKELEDRVVKLRDWWWDNQYQYTGRTAYNGRRCDYEPICR